MQVQAHFYLQPRSTSTFQIQARDEKMPRQDFARDTILEGKDFGQLIVVSPCHGLGTATLAMKEAFRGERYSRKQRKQVQASK
jgi:hypothetical protein